MIPYYSHAGITIYHGDSRELLALLGRFDLLLTDPQYGIGRDGKPRSTSSHGGHKGYEPQGWDGAPPTAEDFARLYACADEWVIWGANYFAPHMKPGPGWLLWDKGQRIDQADGELAATSRKGPLRVFTLNRAALRTDGAVHPTQKPVALFAWCAAFFPDAATLIDPYMGSGTALVVAKSRGMRAIGIDLIESNCENAARRLAQDSLFHEESESERPQGVQP